MTQKHIIIALSILIAILAIFFILPTVPFHRRISVSQAEDLWVEYLLLATKTRQQMIDQNIDHTDNDTKVRAIALKLAKAGWAITTTPDGHDGKQSFALVYPEYAKSNSEE